MSTKEDLIKKLDILLKRSEELNQDLKDLSNLIFYSDLINDKQEIKNEEAIIPVIPEINPTVVTPEFKPVLDEQKNAESFENAEKLRNVEESIPPIRIVEKTYLHKRNFSSKKNSDFEKFVGERLITFIGIAILVTGIGFFVKYAIDKDWINETGRTCIGILCGGILLGIAHRLRKNFTTFSSILVGGGIAVLYFTISYAFQSYRLFSQAQAFAILVGITAFTVLLSIFYERQELAVLAIIGGFGSPLMVSNGQGNFPVLCSYMLILILGMLALAWYRKWNIVNSISYFFTIILFAGALKMEIDKHEPAYITALIFATAFYLIFFGMNVINNLKKRKSFGAMEIIVLLSNSFLYYSAGYYILRHVHDGLLLGLFTAGVGVFNFFFAFMLFRRSDVDRNLVYYLIGLVLTFVSLAGPVQLNGSYITLFWASEAVLLLWLFQKSKIVLIRYASLVVNLLLIVSLFMDWNRIYLEYYPKNELPSIGLNKAFITSIFTLLSFCSTLFLLKKEGDLPFLGKSFSANIYRRTLSIVFIVMLYFAFLFEILFQFNSRSESNYCTEIIFALYTSCFILIFLAAAKISNLAYLKIPGIVLGVLAMLVFFVFPHNAEIIARDSFLSGNWPAERIPFMFHFVNTALFIGIVFFVRHHLFSIKELDKKLKSIFLWFMCVVLVFAGSSELDHLFVLDMYNPLHPDIDHYLEQSRRIGYPILWGLFSFVVILIGMRQRSRQLRIISLTLFFITIIKLILLGIYGGSEAGKIIAFISSGVILLVVAFMYQKLKKLFLDDELTGQTIEHDSKSV